MQKVTLVVPCFNEAKRLSIPDFTAFLAECAEVRLVFVDDGSTDATPERLAALQDAAPEQVETFRLETNSGKAEAVRQGMRRALAARTPFVGYWDADLAAPPETVRPMLERFELHPGLEIVVGCRLRRLGSDIRRSLFRHLAGRGFATAASLHLRLPVYDTQCGAKLFRDRTAAELFREPFVTRWLFDVELFDRFLAANGHEAAIREIEEFPLPEWHDVSGSTLKWSSALRIAREFLRLWRHYRKSVTLRSPQGDDGTI